MSTGMLTCPPPFIQYRRWLLVLLLTVLLLELHLQLPLLLPLTLMPSMTKAPDLALHGLFLLLQVHIPARGLEIHSQGLGLGPEDTTNCPAVVVWVVVPGNGSIWAISAGLTVCPKDVGSSSGPSRPP